MRSRNPLTDESFTLCFRSLRLIIRKKGDRLTGRDFQTTTLNFGGENETALGHTPCAPYLPYPEGLAGQPRGAALTRMKATKAATQNVTFLLPSWRHD
ncbi:MAG TPA: hypothetical protein VK211_12535 [Kamptonema sp.]|nr:hypothetical protein [Kamptonema sp.]